MKSIYAHTLYFVFLVYWFCSYLTPNLIPSVDLPSFIYITELLKLNFFNGNITFYDPYNFCGWSPFLFYGFLPSLSTAILSFLLTLFTDENVRLAAHLSLAVGTALLPLSVYYAAVPFVKDILKREELTKSEAIFLSLGSFTLTFWFINHDRQWYGIGAAAVMNIGLYSQLFAWHFLLFYLGALARIVSGSGHKKLFVLIFSLAALIVTHLMTAAFALFIGGLTFLWYYEYRKKLFSAHIIAACLSAFWLVPFLYYAGEYLPLDIHRPKGDFLELFFRYPFWGFYQSIKSWAGGESFIFNPTNLLAIVLVVLVFFNKNIPRSGIVRTYFFFLLCALVFFNSGYVATSLQLGFHYYRFNAYVFLALVVILSAVTTTLGLNVREAVSKINLRYFLAVLVLVLCSIFTACLPHYEREMISKNARSDYLTSQEQVLEYFRNLPEKGRVYIEHLTDYKKFPKLSVHYLASRMYKETGFEILPNSHLQEAPAYRMIAAAAKKLNAKTYNVPLLYVSDSDLEDEDLILQLKDFGITHIIAGTLRFYERIQPFAVEEPKRIGKYYLVQIQKAPFQKIVEVNKKLIAYFDQNKTAPFKFLQYYFYSRKDLYKNYDLIDVNGSSFIPANVDVVIVNGNISNVEKRTFKDRNLITFNYSNKYVLDHYHPHYPHNTELDAYKDFADYIENRARLDKKLRVEATDVNLIEGPGVLPKLTFADNSQTIAIKDLEPGKIYKLNYTFMPFWKPKGARIFRGTGERIFIRAASSESNLTYSQWNADICFLALVLSLSTLLMYIFIVILIR